MMSCLRERAIPSMPMLCATSRSSGAVFCFSSVKFIRREDRLECRLADTDGRSKDGSFSRESLSVWNQSRDYRNAASAVYTALDEKAYHDILTSSTRIDPSHYRFSCDCSLCRIEHTPSQIDEFRSRYGQYRPMHAKPKVACTLFSSTNCPLPAGISPKAIKALSAYT